LAMMVSVARRLCPRLDIRPCAESADCVRNADFVFTSIRAGGIARRARDERIALEHGVVGQETVGPAGFAMALGNIPPMLEYAREVETLAPGAWIVNFTNPVGVVTQAVQSRTRARIIGICDTPFELCRDAARVLDLEPAACRFDYVGLNHLGWLREIYLNGEPRIAPLWRDASALDRVYRRRLFDPSFLQSMRLLPTEYVYYYLYPARATEALRSAARTRGEEIESLNVQLFADLQSGTKDAGAVYFEYLASRDAGYMAAEAGNRRPAQGGAEAPRPHERAFPSAASRVPPADRAITGYDRIALSVVDAIWLDTGAHIPLNVRNGTALPELEPDDVVEVPCAVTRKGPAPQPTASLPPQVRGLVEQVKAYERLTIEAAVHRSDEIAREALTLNPLVGSPDLAAALVDALRPLW